MRPIEVEFAGIDRQADGDHAATAADRDLLDIALRRLDASWRAVVVLHYYLGVPLPEVATTLGIPLGTAKSRLHRSLLAMRDEMTVGHGALEDVREGQPA